MYEVERSSSHGELEYKWISLEQPGQSQATLNLYLFKKKRGLLLYKLFRQPYIMRPEFIEISFFGTTH